MPALQLLKTRWWSGTSPHRRALVHHLIGVFLSTTSSACSCPPPHRQSTTPPTCQAAGLPPLTRQRERQCPPHERSTLCCCTCVGAVMTGGNAVALPHGRLWPHTPPYPHGHPPPPPYFRRRSVGPPAFCLHPPLPFSDCRRPPQLPSHCCRPGHSCRQPPQGGRRARVAATSPRRGGHSYRPCGGAAAFASATDTVRPAGAKTVATGVASPATVRIFLYRSSVWTM